MTADEFYRSLLSLIENAPDGVDQEVLDHLTAASDSLNDSMDEGISPGQQAAKEAMPEDAEEDMNEGESYESPGKEAAIQATQK